MLDQPVLSTAVHFKGFCTALCEVSASSKTDLLQRMQLKIVRAGIVIVWLQHLSTAYYTALLFTSIH